MKDKLQIAREKLSAAEAEELAERLKVTRAEQEHIHAERREKEAIQQAEMDAVKFASTNQELERMYAAISKSLNNPLTPIVVNYLLATSRDFHSGMLAIESYFRHADSLKEVK